MSVSPSILSSLLFCSTSCSVTRPWFTDEFLWSSSTDFSRSLWRTRFISLSGKKMINCTRPLKTSDQDYEAHQTFNKNSSDTIWYDPLFYVLDALISFSELTAAAGWVAPPGWGTWVSPPPLGGAVSGAGPPACAWRPASWGSAPTPSASAGTRPSPGSPAETHRHVRNITCQSF